MLNFRKLQNDSLQFVLTAAKDLQNRELQFVERSPVDCCLMGRMCMWEGKAVLANFQWRRKTHPFCDTLVMTGVHTCRQLTMSLTP